MKIAYFRLIKTLLAGAVIGSAANMLTNVSEYFGSKVVKTVSHTLNSKNEELSDDEGHKITYQYCQTANVLLETLLEGTVAAEKVLKTVTKVFAFAQEEKIPCNCIPLLSLFSLKNLNIAIIVDDSSSMGTGTGTRWEECKKLVHMVVKYGLLSENNTLSLRFLNRPDTYPIKNLDMIDALFSIEPSGGTPIIKALEETITQIQQVNTNKQDLIYVFTDGIPDDGAYYQPTLTWIRDAFAVDKKRSENIAINFVLIGTNSAVEREYKKADDFVLVAGQTLHIDTNFAYKSQQARCSDIHLSEGLYKMKILMGAVSEDFDELDDPQQGHLIEDSLRLQFLKNSWDSLKECNDQLLVQQRKEL